MSDNQQLALSNVIEVTILPTPTNLGVVNINTLALITQDAPSGWAGGQTFAIYTNATDVATDFGSDSSATAIATEFFAQNPNCLTTGGYLAIIPRLTSPSLETVRAAIARTLNSVFYFGVVMDEELATSDATEFAALAAYVQTLDKMLFYCSSDINDLQPGSPLDLVRQASEHNTRCFYYGNEILNGNGDPQTQMFAAAYAGRALSTDFSGSNTAMTMNLKALAGVTPDQTIGQTQLLLAKTAGIDVYVSIAGIPGLLTSGENEYFDDVYNEFWLQFALESAGFNYLAGTNAKIPQTEAGMTGLKDAYAQVLAQAVRNGVSAPGSWTSPDVFGDPALLRSNVANIGYYIYSVPVAQQSVADRAARKAPLVQIALKLAGAIHSSSVIVNVNA